MKFINSLFIIVVFSLLVTGCAKSKEELGIENGYCKEDHTCNDGLICINDVCIEDKCLDINCIDNWMECNSKTGECTELKENHCVQQDDCKENEICTSEHTCMDKLLECNPKCNDSYEVCKENQCELREGHCILQSDCKENESCIKNECVDSSCGDNICNNNSEDPSSCHEDCNCLTIDNMCSHDQICDENILECVIVTDIGTLRHLESNLGDGEKGSYYHIEGIVEGIESNGFYIQSLNELGTTLSGIYVFYKNDPTPEKPEVEPIERGEHISVIGSAYNYFGLLELTKAVVEHKENVATNVLEYKNLLYDDLDNLEQYESLLVNIPTSIDLIVGETNEFDEAIITTSASGATIKVRKDIYDYGELTTGAHLNRLSGVLTFHFGEYKILPTIQDDIQVE